MSGYNWENEDFDADERGGDDNPIKALRKIEREQKAQIKELQEALGQMKAQVRERSVKDVLAQNGLSEKIAKFIPDDITSAEDVSAWVSENAEIFGSPVPEPTTGGEETTDPDAQSQERIANAMTSGMTASGDAGQIEALIAAADSPEELNKLLFGNTSGPSVV